MSQPTRTDLNSVLMGDELGQIKLVQLNPHHSRHEEDEDSDELAGEEPRFPWSMKGTSTLDGRTRKNHRHRIVRVLDDCLQRGPAASRAITNIRGIEGSNQCDLDTTDKPNNLFLISNKVGQLFVCDTNAIRKNLEHCTDFELKYHSSNIGDEEDFRKEGHSVRAPMLSPVYYNMNSRVPVCGGQPINQTNILVVYQNGDIQHVSIGQDVLQSSLKIRRKAIRLLGLGYNSDARAVHWRIDGSSGVCYFDSDSSSSHIDANDPLTDLVVSSPTHKLSTRRADRSQQNLFNKSPCIKSRKCNEHDRLVPTQVINMITSRPDQYKPSSRICKWSSITSLNLIYRKLALYDLVGSENFQRYQGQNKFRLSSYKLNDNRLAVGGYKYALRVYDVQTQKNIYNSIMGSSGGSVACPPKGESSMIGDIDWLGGNKTTRKSPQMLATCSGLDSIVHVYDLRSPKPVFCIDLAQETDNKWQPYENHHRGCVFIRICASGAPHSTAVPSQQLALGSTNGQLHILDLRFVARSHRSLGKLSGFCGGSVREIRFVAESLEISRMISCATDRFIRIHKIQTSFTSVVSQKLATKVFLGTKPTCIQPVCDEVTQHYLTNLLSRCESESHVSTIGSGWSSL